MTYLNQHQQEMLRAADFYRKFDVAYAMIKLIRDMDAELDARAAMLDACDTAIANRDAVIINLKAQLANFTQSAKVGDQLSPESDHVIGVINEHWSPQYTEVSFDAVNAPFELPKVED